MLASPVAPGPANPGPAFTNSDPSACPAIPEEAAPVHGGTAKAPMIGGENESECAAKTDDQRDEQKNIIEGSEALLLYGK